MTSSQYIPFSSSCRCNQSRSFSSAASIASNNYIAVHRLSGFRSWTAVWKLWVWPTSTWWDTLLLAALPPPDGHVDGSPNLMRKSLLRVLLPRQSQPGCLLPIMSFTISVWAFHSHLHVGPFTLYTRGSPQAARSQACPADLMKMDVHEGNGCQSPVVSNRPSRMLWQTVFHAFLVDVPSPACSTWDVAICRNLR